MTGNQGDKASPSPAPPAGWYVEAGSVRQRYWDGFSWGPYAPTSSPSVLINQSDGRTAMIVGYSMAGASLIVPIVGIAGLVLGIITATKPGRGGHGAAIICLSVILGAVSWVFWTSVVLSSAT